MCFLIRKKLNLKLYEKFRFANQKSSTDCYYFNETSLMKIPTIDGNYFPPRKASVSLNFLLSEEIDIRRVR